MSLKSLQEDAAKMLYQETKRELKASIYRACLKDVETTHGEEFVAIATVILNNDKNYRDYALFTLCDEIKSLCKEKDVYISTSTAGDLGIYLYNLMKYMYSEFVVII